MRLPRRAMSEDAAPIPLSGDTFLYLRADIVAKGKAVVERVLADPAVVLTRRWDDGEALLYAASAATGDEIETKVSYETGSNEQHWSPVEFDPSTHRAPIVAVLLSDLLSPFEAYADQSMTTRVDPVEFSWPLWFPFDVVAAVNDQLNALVGDGGGIPESLQARQIRIDVGFVDESKPVPAIEWDAMDDPELGRVVNVCAQLRRTQVRAWEPSRQRQALQSLAATCCLAVLPKDHGSRSALQHAVAEGARLLPPPD